MKTPLEVTVLEDVEGFAALEEQWEDLYRNCPSATPFQSWAWLYSWWENYGENYELRIVTLHSEGLLVGVLPLMLQRRFGFTRLLFVGTGITDYLDLLAREGWEREVSEAGVQVLSRLGPWQVADLQELRPEAAAWSLFSGWDAHRVQRWQVNSPVLDAKPWEEVLPSVSKNLRSTARRTIRKVEEDGVRNLLVKAEDAEEATRRTVALHREAWQGREIDPHNLTDTFESHLVAAVGRLSVRGLGGIGEFRRDGEVLVSHLLLFGRNFIATYMLGATQEASRRYQVSTIEIWSLLSMALDKNYNYIDFLRGEEQYKLRWCSRAIVNHRMILGRRLLPWSLYKGYLALKSRYPGGMFWKFVSVMSRRRKY